MIGTRGLPGLARLGATATGTAIQPMVSTVPSTAPQNANPAMARAASPVTQSPSGLLRLAGGSIPSALAAGHGIASDPAPGPRPSAGIVRVKVVGDVLDQLRRSSSESHAAADTFGTFLR